jgi:hypothetical protein
MYTSPTALAALAISRGIPLHHRKGNGAMKTNRENRGQTGMVLPESQLLSAERVAVKEL